MRQEDSDPVVGILKHQAPTFPFTIGLKAIKGSSAVPVPSVLFKFGAGYRFGKPGTAVAVGGKPEIAAPRRGMLFSTTLSTKFGALLSAGRPCGVIDGVA